MMSGWSTLVDDELSSMHRCKISDEGFVKGTKNNKTQKTFFELVSVFLKGTCPSDSFRPLPPMLGNGHSVDLLKLYYVVKQKGGFDAISKNGLWDDVALLYGLGPGFGSAIKLVYLKYLETLESWLVKLSKDSNSNSNTGWSGIESRNFSQEALMELQNDYNTFLSNISEEMRETGECYIFKVDKSDINFVDLTDDNKGKGNDKFKRKKTDKSFNDVVDLTQENDDDNLKFKRKKVEMSSTNDVDLPEENNDNDNVILKPKTVEMSCSNNVEFMKENHDGGELLRMKSETSCADSRSSIGPVVADNVIKSSENSVVSKKSSIEAEEELMNVDSSTSKEEVSSHERKPDCLSRMLSWMANVAKDPTDPWIDTIPENSRWALYGNDNCRKQVLLAREALFLKRDQISGAEQCVWQKKQKMHPSMFDDQLEAAERPRSSPRLFSTSILHESDANRGRPRQRLGARLDQQPTASIYTSRPQQRIPVGQDFQAEIPEWTGVGAKSDSKWLGTRVWPLEKRQCSLIERDPIGKGRIDTCGCQWPGSAMCVKFHVAERRTKMKVELGSAFYSWSLDKMGEECSVSWTAEDEKKFEVVVKENPKSLYKRFWPKMSKVLPRKSLADLVNYYFNVFLLRRRGFQNRHTPSNIDSDDDETEYGLAINRLGHNSCVSSFSSKNAQTSIKYF